ncbi:ABC-type Fe3+ transport system permease subunit [Paraburkholderia atlantica]
MIALAAVTLVPTVVLIVVSLTPLSLTNPAASFRFDDPLVNYRQLLHDTRFLDSVRTQLKLSVASVTSQLAIGLGLALLLDGKSAFLRGVRTVFLIPMVLPPIVAALIWKILYSPDISPLHRVLESAGYPVSSLIANPSTALWAVAAADTWQWFPFTMLMVLATLQTIPDDPLEAASLDGAGALAIVPLYRAAIPASSAGGLRIVPAHRQLQGVPIDLRVDQRRPRHRNGSHQLLQLHRGIQFLLLGLRERDCDGHPRRCLPAELAGRQTRME